jgi:hypothetical protein
MFPRHGPSYSQSLQLRSPQFATEYGGALDFE